MADITYYAINDALNGGDEIKWQAASPSGDRIESGDSRKFLLVHNSCSENSRTITLTTHTTSTEDYIVPAGKTWMIGTYPPGAISEGKIVITYDDAGCLTIAGCYWQDQY